MIPHTPLSALSTVTNGTGPNTWIERDSWLGPILDPYVSLLGEGLVAAILSGSLLLGFYIYADSIAIPAILLLLLGGVLSTALPAPMLRVGRTVIIIGLAATLFAVAREYVLE